MASLLDTLIDFNEPVLRNAVWIGPKNNAFDDLSQHSVDWNEAEILCKNTSTTLLTENEIQHQAIEYVFTRENGLPSRFSNGSFPVWYGSLERDTTFYETAFHWKHTLLADAGFLKIKKPLYATRRLFKANCTSTLIDIRSKTKNYPFLLERDTNRYQETQTLGSKLSKEGFPGFLTLSARTSSGTNIIVFNKKILHHPQYESDYLYAILPNSPHKIQVMHYHSRELVLEIE